MKARRFAGAGIASACLALSAAACQAIVGIHEYETNDPGDGGRTSSTTDANGTSDANDGRDAGDAAPTFVDECHHAVPPASNGGSLLGEPLFLALDTLNFAPPPGSDSGVVGFDLDGICTNFKGPTFDDGGPSCVAPKVYLPSVPPMSVPPMTDQAGGVDNALQPIFTAAQGILGSDVIPTNEDIHKGQQTLLLRVLGYGGGPDWTGLKVAAIISEQLEVTTNCDAGTFRLADAAPDGPAGDAGDAETDADAGDGGDAGNATTAPPMPTFDGCDIWSVSATSVGPSLGPAAMREGLFNSTDAYVVDGVLVAKFDSLRLPVGGVELTVRGAELTANIGRVTLDGGASIVRLTNGLMGGRVLASDLLNVFKTLSLSTGSNIGICPGQTVYDDLLKPALCNAVDVTHDPEAGLDSPCDAISFGVSMSAVQTRAEGDVIQSIGLHVFSNCDAAPDRCENLP